jgi:hypothetical protein
MYPFESDRDDDRSWLEELAAAHGAAWPEVEMASSPGQVDLAFPAASDAASFVHDLERANRGFSIVVPPDL